MQKSYGPYVSSFARVPKGPRWIARVRRFASNAESRGKKRDLIYPPPRISNDVGGKRNEEDDDETRRGERLVTTPRAIVPAAITVRVAVYAQTIPDVESGASFMAPYLRTHTHAFQSCECDGRGGRRGKGAGGREREREVKEDGGGKREARVYIYM